MAQWVKVPFTSLIALTPLLGENSWNVSSYLHMEAWHIYAYTEKYKHTYTQSYYIQLSKRFQIILKNYFGGCQKPTASIVVC